MILGCFLLTLSLLWLGFGALAGVFPFHAQGARVLDVVQSANDLFEVDTAPSRRAEIPTSDFAFIELAMYVPISNFAGSVFL